MGDVVWGPDAYHDDDPYLLEGRRRPWLVLTNATFPGQGRHYICCAVTSGTTRGPSLIELASNRDWETGGTPKRSQIDTETLFTLKHRWIGKHSGRLAYARLSEARERIKSYL